MRKKSIVGMVMTIALLALVGCSGGAEANDTPEGVDLKPVIYLYPQEDGSEISVSLDYDGEITDLIPEFNAENTWNVTANKDGKINFEGTEYDYLFWEGVPRFEYDFFTGYCVKGSETEGFLREKLAEQGLASQTRSSATMMQSRKRTASCSNRLFSRFITIIR